MHHLIFEFDEHWQGTLRGFDQTINLVLYEAHERVYSADAGIEMVPLGLYVIRGDNVFVNIRTLILIFFGYKIIFILSDLILNNFALISAAASAR